MFYSSNDSVFVSGDTLRNLFTELECTIVFSLATSAKFENLLFIRSDCNRSPDGSAARILSM